MNIDPTPSTVPHRPTRHALRILALVSVATMTVAACSSDAGDEPAAATTPEPTASTATTPAAVETEPSSVPNGPGIGTKLVGDIPLTLTVPDGWNDDEGWGVLKNEPAVGILFQEVSNTYSDSCPSVALDPPVGPTVDDLAAVWADLPTFNATTPTDITVDGFAGKLVEFTIPDYDEADCAYGDFMLLEHVDTPGDGYWVQGPNQTHQLRILDIDGTRVVIIAIWYPDTSAQDRADIDAMLDSIQIG